MLKSRLPRIADALPARIDVAAKATAEIVERAAKARAPVDTGKLRAAIHTEDIGAGEYTVLAGDDDVFYGHLVEFGTVETPARPFMIPAAEAARVTALAAGRSALKGL